MLRPTAFTFASDPAEDDRVFVQLDRLTGIVGGNDVGKTRLLAQLYRSCAAIEAASGHRVADLPDRLLRAAELPMLICAADEEALRRGFDVPAPADLVEGITDHAMLHAAGGDREPIRILVRHALKAPSIIMLPPAIADGGLAAPVTLSLATPLPPLHATPEAHAALTALGLHGHAHWPSDVPVPLVGLGGDWRDETLRRWRPPTAVWLPADEDQVADAVQDAVGSLLSALTHFEDARHRGDLTAFGLDPSPPGAVNHWNAAFEQLVRDPWLHPVLNPYDGSEQVNPWLSAAAGLVSAVADHLLPPFVARSYELRVWPSPLSRWIDGGWRVWPGMRRRGKAEHPFRSASVAEGYRIWVQLTLLDTARVVTQIATWLSDSFSRGARSAHGIEGLTPWLEDVESLVEALSALDQPDRPVTINDAQGIVEGAHPYAGSAPQIADIRSEEFALYLFDEPERHLHPSVQREAAAWLADSRGSGSDGAIFATHAVPFMELGQRTRYVYAYRDGTGTPRLEPMDPATLGAADVAAGELGLDRGELLALVRRLIFVEGETDRVFLEGLYGPELKRAGIVLVALGGATKASSVVPMAMLLLQYTTARVSVMLDDLSRDVFESLRTDAVTRNEAARSAKQVEVRELARVLAAAAERERDIEPLGIPVKDIFDLIDENVVREELCDRGKEPFPGHDAARAAAGDSRWKDVYLKRYGINILDIDTFARAGNSMRSRGCRSLVLDEVLELGDAEPPLRLALSPR